MVYYFLNCFMRWLLNELDKEPAIFSFSKIWIGISRYMMDNVYSAVDE